MMYYYLLSILSKIMVRLPDVRDERIAPPLAPILYKYLYLSPPSVRANSVLRINT